MKKLAAVLLVLLPLQAEAQDGAAGDTPSSTDRRRTALREYYDAMAARRLIAPETGSVESLRALVERGERLYFDDRFEEAQRVLYEAVESPRFSDFDSNDEYRNAEYLLAGALQRLGALRSAWRYLERILARGPQDPYFGPAYRRAIDVALAGAEPNAAIEQLRAIAPPESLDADQRNELLYLQGRERYDAHDWAAAASIFEQVGRQSRFYANARYLQGTIAAQAGELEAAEAHFCSIATTSDTDQFTFFVDRRYFDIRDLTWLALGRVAHEGRRPEDSFYYYFQVPQDSARVEEALFESAWAMYEGDDHDTAIDLIDQLEARFPDSPFVHEASLLRGYVHLARCEFDEADREFIRFQQRFTPVVEALDAILESPARQGRLFEDLLASQERGAQEAAEHQAPGEGNAAPADVNALLYTLLSIDPDFYRLYAEVRTLDAEAARAGRVEADLGEIQARLSGGEAPQPSVREEALDDITALRRDLDGARAILRALTEQLDAMRREGAARDRVQPLEREIGELGRRVSALERRLNELASHVPPEAPVEGGDIEGILRRDRSLAARFDARVADVRARMVGAANDAALRSVHTLRRDLSGYLRRSRIGRIDAVMGSKRRIEIQIESLAAGRFPPELQDPLAIQGLLRDDEEYWPFEGEYWQDEFEEDEDEDDLELEDEAPPAEEEEAIE
jgi:hypothetical protein